MSELCQLETVRTIISPNGRLVIDTTLEDINIVPSEPESPTPSVSPILDPIPTPSFNNACALTVNGGQLLDFSLYYQEEDPENPGGNLAARDKSFPATGELPYNYYAIRIEGVIRVDYKPLGLSNIDVDISLRNDDNSVIIEHIFNVATTSDEINEEYVYYPFWITTTGEFSGVKNIRATIPSIQGLEIRIVNLNVTYSSVD